MVPNQNVDNSYRDRVVDIQNSEFCQCVTQQFASNCLPCILDYMHIYVSINKQR